MIERIWETRACDETQAAAVAAALGVSPVTARLLCIRGMADVETARQFLSPSLGALHDPFRLTDMAPA
jgi:single-stranded-DNA-specific exonuclease